MPAAPAQDLFLSEISHIRVRSGLAIFLDKELSRITREAHGFIIQLAELPLADVAVIALQLLLGLQLQAEIRRLLATLAMLAGAIFPTVDRALRPTPQVDAKAAVDLVFRFLSLAHVASGLSGLPLPPAGATLVHARWLERSIGS
ncbi:hypothetical protein WCLP8_640001 [uncultured Gammaproteobacteria bacterium]